MKQRLKALWIALVRPQYVINCDEGMHLLKEVWAWTVHKNTPWAINTDRVLKQYFRK